MNQDKFIPYSKQIISEEDIKEVNKVLRSPLITQGPISKEFESRLADVASAKYAISTNSATSALHISCLALGLEKGDILWTSPNTFVASANCALYCDASIDFVDIDISTGLISIHLLEEKLRKAKKEKKIPKIIVPVHFAGTSCAMKEIFRLSKEYGFSIIEDASHALGGSYNRDPVGSCKYSDITIFSFHPVKMITTGEGGMITTNDLKLAKRLEKLKSHGITKNKSEFIGSKIFSWTYEQQDLGFNYRMSDINAALGLSQLKRIRNIVKERNNLLSNYKSLLSTLPITFLEIPKDVISSVHLAVILLEPQLAIHHSVIFDLMRKSNIGVQLHYIPVHTQPYYQSIGFKEGQFPASEDYSSRAFSLPLFPGLTFSQQEYIYNQLKINFKKVM